MKKFLTGIGILVLLIFVLVYFFGLERDDTNFEQGNGEFSGSVAKK